VADAIIHSDVTSVADAKVIIDKICGAKTKLFSGPSCRDSLPDKVSGLSGLPPLTPDVDVTMDDHHPGFGYGYFYAPAKTGTYMTFPNSYQLYGRPPGKWPGR
jgi:hypothetical protein